MPRYRATLTDGRVVEFDAAQPPSEADIMAALGGSPSASAPTGVPEPDEPTSHPGLLSRAMGVINTVPKQLQQGVANAIDLAQGDVGWQEAGRRQLAALHPDSTVSGETVAEAAGMTPGLLRSAVGLGLDFITPMGLGATAASKLVTNPLARQLLANPVTAALKGTGKVAMAVPKVAETVENLQKPFVQFHGLDKFAMKNGLNAQEAFRLQESAKAAARSEGRQQAVHAFRGVDNVADRWAIANHLENPAQTPLTPELQAVADEVKTLLSTQADELEQAKLLDPTKRRANYFPQVREMDDIERALVADATKGVDKYTKQRRLTWAEHLATGKAVDPVEALATRLGSGREALRTSSFLDDVTKEFGQALNTPGTRRVNLRDLTLTEGQQKAMQQVAFPHEIAAALERGNVILNDPGQWKKTWIGLNRAFKTGVTTFNPAHHANNWQGNMYMMYLAGMPLKDIAKAYIGRSWHEVSDLLNAKAPRTLPIYGQTIGGKSTSTVGDAFEAAKKYNLFGSSEAALELERVTANKGAIGRAADNVRLQSSRYIEDPAKWALFKDQLRKGKTPEQAALHVKKFLFDYSELTDLERGLRDYGVVPFYAWMRKNIPLHLNQLIENPGRVRAAQLAYTAPGRLAGRPDEVLAQPDWLADEGYQPVDRALDNPVVNRLFGAPSGDGSPMVRLANPALDLNRLGSVGGFLKANLGPIPRAIAELSTGRDLRSGQKILGTDTGYAAASPLGTLATSLEMQTGIPMPRFGTEPTLEGKTVQPELAAYIMNQIPLPLVQYAQQIAGSPGETLGSQLETPMGRRFLNIALRTIGLTPRDLTTEQQMKAFELLVNGAVEKELKQDEIQQMGESLRQP